jgi:Ca2+-binding RTX toxin-like protein
MVAAPARASTAQLMEVLLPEAEACKHVPPGGTCDRAADALVYQAAPRETNVVRLTGDPGNVRISDRGAVIEPGQGCSRIARRSVSCSSETGLEGIFVATGGGKDTVTSELYYGGTWFDERIILNGGPGNDVLVGGPAWDKLYGGKGADVLRGRGGDDRLYDASPQDPLRSGAPSPFGEAQVVLANPGRWRDSFYGGTGQDRISYETRVVGVKIDLANPAAVGGARGERDSVRGVEGAVGGAGDDLLAGSRRVNGLDGGEGDDRIVGRQGGDFIEGGTGRNIIVAGPGDDQINGTYRPSDYGAERIFCGAGLDSVSWLFPSDFVNDDCEGLSFNFLKAGPVYGGGPRSALPLREGRPPMVLSGELACFAPSRCEVTLEVRVHGPGARDGTAPPPGTLLGSQSFVLEAFVGTSVSLDLSPAGLEILQRHRALRVLVTITEEPAQPPVGYQTVLRAP